VHRKSHWRFFALRWHRRIGVVAALFVLNLVVTGILLNHGHELGLDSRPLTSSFWARVYGVPAPTPVPAYAVGSHWLSSRAGKLYFDQQLIADCERLLGSVEEAGQVLVACPRRLVLLGAEGQLVDQADALRGVPDGISALTLRGDTVVLHTAGQTLAVDLSDLSLHPLLSTANGADRVSAVASLPASGPLAPDLTEERLLQDIHSGRILGAWGVWLVDVMALLFAVLALSGLYMARRRKHH
jgi:hypothetical protein